MDDIPRPAMLTAAWLREHEACPGFQQWFATYFGGEAAVPAVVALLFHHCARDWPVWLLAQTPEMTKIVSIEIWNLNIATWFDLTALHIAAQHGRVAVVRELLLRRARVDMRDMFGATPMHHAARRGHVEVMRELLKAGATINAPTAEYETPLDLAEQKGQVAAADFLRSHGGRRGADRFAGTRE